MLALLSPRFLIGLALSIALAFTHGFAYRAGRAAVTSAWTAEKLAASEASRQREKALTIANTKVDDDYQTDKRRRAADAVLNAGKLRELQSAIDSAASANTGATSGTDDPAFAIARECAGALGKLDEYAKGLASQTSALQRYAKHVCMTP